MEAAPLALLAVLQPHARSMARLRAALDGDHVLVPCLDWRDVWDAVQARGVDGCVVEMTAASRGMDLRQLQRLRRRRPPLALVVEADFSGREIDLFSLGRIGVDGVLPAETSPGPAHIHREVERALARALAVRVTETLEGRLSELGRDALRWSIIHATESPTVEELATAIGRTPASFARDLRESHLPPPRRILLWGRLFQGAHLMTRGDRSVEAVALRLGYSSRTALSRAFRRETGLPPTEVTRRGGISCVLEGFLAGGRRRSRSR